LNDQRNAGSRIIEAVADAAAAGARLDRFLAARMPEFSRTRLKQLILAGEVRVGGRTIEDPEYRMSAGDRASVRVPPPEPARPRPEPIPLSIVYEDSELIVIDKPAGLVVHPAAGNRAGTLVNALIAHCGDSLSGIGGERRPGIVHRLDKDTSGLLVVAKTDRAHRALARDFAEHGRTGGLERGYLALVWGVPEPRRGRIEAPIMRDPKARKRMKVRAGGRRAATRYEVRRSYRGIDGTPVASLVECRLETGRTHQVRVHLAHIGHPLLGDPVYGAAFRSKSSRLAPPARAALQALSRQALHAYLLGFRHPLTGQQLRFESPLPPDLSKILESLNSP
jgi:23S rRNA pseudouridine1911/1915/1917 synthase